MLTQLLLISGLLSVNPAFAENTAPKKSTSTTSVYENETDKPKTKTLSAKVKVIRDESDSVEVFFSGNEAKGAYFLYRSNSHFAEYLHRLEESRKPQGAKASVVVNEDDKKIISVDPIGPVKAAEKDMWGSD